MPSFKNINFAISDQVAEGDQSRLKTLRAVSIGTAAGIGWGATPMRVEVNDEYIASAKGVADDLSSQSAEAASRTYAPTHSAEPSSLYAADAASVIAATKP